MQSAPLLYHKKPYTSNIFHLRLFYLSSTLLSSCILLFFSFTSNFFLTYLIVANTGSSLFTFTRILGNAASILLFNIYLNDLFFTIALPITKMPKRSWLKALVVFLVAQILIAWILINFTDSDVPWWDAFTTALSIIGMWMLARKYLEQWWVWIVVDVVCVGLYIYKGLYFTSGLYALYSVIAVFGWLNWKRLMKASSVS